MFVRVLSFFVCVPDYSCAKQMINYKTMSILSWKIAMSLQQITTNNKGQSESTKLENATVFRKENNLLRALDFWAFFKAKQDFNNWPHFFYNISIFLLKSPTLTPFCLGNNPPVHHPCAFQWPWDGEVWYPWSQNHHYGYCIWGDWTSWTSLYQISYVSCCDLKKCKKRHI